MFFGDTITGVVKREVGKLGGEVVTTEMNLTTIASIAHTVLHQVAEDGIDQGVIAVKGQFVGQIDKELHVSIAQLFTPNLHVHRR